MRRGNLTRVGAVVSSKRSTELLTIIGKWPLDLSVSLVRKVKKRTEGRLGIRFAHPRSCPPMTLGRFGVSLNRLEQLSRQTCGPWSATLPSLQATHFLWHVSP